MYKSISTFFAAAVCAIILPVAAADLVLKNGRVYKNYRIKTVSADKVTIAFLASDGSPDIAEVKLSDLPSEITASLGISSPNKVVAEKKNSIARPEDLIVQLSDQLKKEFAALPAGEIDTRRLLISKASELLKKKLAAYFSDAEFETVWNSAEGITARVTRVNKSSFLKVGDKVFIRSSTQLGNRFRAQVYAAGCMVVVNGERLQMMGFDENSAVNFAMECILSAIGFKEDQGNVKKLPSDGSAANTTVPPAVEKPVINNYYVYDDDDEPVYIIRDGRRYYPPYPSGRYPSRPGNRPAVRPENNRPAVRPENNRPAVRPENNRPSPKEKLSKNKSIIQRDDSKIHSYDHLPDWAQPRYSRP